jgi:hypothetical protein
MKEEALDRTLWRTCLGRGSGPVVKTDCVTTTIDDDDDDDDDDDSIIEYYFKYHVLSCVSIRYTQIYYFKYRLASFSHAVHFCKVYDVHSPQFYLIKMQFLPEDKAAAA